jgi:hypothetical protein
LIVQNFLTELAHQLDHIMKIVDGRQSHAGYFAGFEEVVDIGPAETIACRTLAIVANRTEIGTVAAFGQVDRSIFSESDPVPSCARGIRAVKSINPQWNALMDRF